MTGADGFVDIIIAGTGGFVAERGERSRGGHF